MFILEVREYVGDGDTEFHCRENVELFNVPQKFSFNSGNIEFWAMLVGSFHYAYGDSKNECLEMAIHEPLELEDETLIIKV